MTLDLRNKARIPPEWLFDNTSGADFSDVDPYFATANPDAAGSNSNDTPIDQLTAHQTVSVNGTLESFLGQPLLNESTVNDYLFNDSESYFPFIPGDEGVLLSEDNTRANSISWDSTQEFGNPFPIQSIRETTDDVGQENIFDVNLPSDQAGFLPSESSAVQRSVGDSGGLRGFQPPLRNQSRPEKAPSTFKTGKRNSKSIRGATKNPKHRSKVSLPLSEQQVEEAYYHLDINYRFKPYPTKEQMHALAVVVELPYDRVRAFYEQRQSQAPLSVSNSSQLEHGPGVSNPAKRHCGSDSSSSSELVGSAYGTYRSDSSPSLQTSERSAIPRALYLSNQVREPSQKPYECTWRACQKAFASKSDWRRHEEVHCPQWCWACTLDRGIEGNSSNAMPCTRKFKRDDHLRDHLKKDHRCADLSKVEAGRQPLIPKIPFNRQCGFCGHMTRDWIDRIDHIADHFKDGKRMSEWRNDWPEGGFEEGSDPGDDDDDGDTDKNDNNNSTSDKQSDPRTDSGKDNWKDGNSNSQNGRYLSSGRGYVRPGSFGIRYKASNREPSIDESLKRRDDAFTIDDAASLSPFWSRIRNLLKNRKRQRGIASASSASRDSDRQDEERIDFYCILCLKLISTDPSPQNNDDSYCNCSKAAIKDHINSLTNFHPGLPMPEKSKVGGRSEQKDQKGELGPDVPWERVDRDKVFKSHLLHAVGGHPLEENELKRLATLDEAPWQHRAAIDAQDESLSFSMLRYLKLNSPSEDSSESCESPQGNNSLRFLQPG